MWRQASPKPGVFSKFQPEFLNTDMMQWCFPLPLPLFPRDSLGFRVFGSKPGAYGAGLQGLIDGKNWTTSDDLANAYINWSGYAYHGKNNSGKSAHETFKKRLSNIENVSIKSLRVNQKEQNPTVNTSEKVINDWRNWKF